MPRIIRKALSEKLSHLPEFQRFMEDFKLATGLTLTFWDEFGMKHSDHIHDSLLCQHLAGKSEGLKFCQHTQQSLCAKAASEAVSCRCDAGLYEVAVPIRVGKYKVGYLTFGGIRIGLPKKNELRQIRLLLARSKIDVTEPILYALHTDTREILEASIGAYIRIVSMASRQFAMQLTDHIMQPPAPLPALVEKARRHIRSNAVVEEISLSSVATVCSVSVAHLSRIFHHATGLTFTEYVSHVRAEHSFNIIKNTSRSITEIAFSSGFQSLSQFNRTFKKVFGTTPSAIRKKKLRHEVSGDTPVVLVRARFPLRR